MVTDWHKKCLRQANLFMGSVMLRKILFAVSALALSMGVHASPVQYGFTVSGGWFDAGGTPFGMPLSPTLNGLITVDSATSEINAFSLTTGTKTWTLADNPLQQQVSFIGGTLAEFGLWDFQSTDGYFVIFSNNTMSVSDSLWQLNACNNCVSINGIVPNEVPEPTTPVLLGLGVLAISASCRKHINKF